MLEEEIEQRDYLTPEEIEVGIKTQTAIHHQDRIITLINAIMAGVVLTVGDERVYEYALGKKHRLRIEELIVNLAEDMASI